MTTSSGSHSSVSFGFSSSPRYPLCTVKKTTTHMEVLQTSCAAPSQEVVERCDGQVGMGAKAGISKILRGDILGIEWVFLESLKLDHRSPLHPLRSEPSAQHTPFQTLELHSFHVPLQPCKMPKHLQGSLLRIANHFYIELDKAQSRRKKDPYSLLKAAQ